MRPDLRTGSLSVLTALLLAAAASAGIVTTEPYRGVTHHDRTETTPRSVHMHIVQIDLGAPGLRFELTPHTQTPNNRETLRTTTLGFLNQRQAQLAVNVHFFLPFPSGDPDANLVGFAASQGTVYSGFEAPTQSYAIVTNAPALNIDASNQAGILHCDTSFADGLHVLENVSIHNAFAGSAQIITNGVRTIPEYKDGSHPDGLLTPNQTYSNGYSWYGLPRARTVMGLSADNRTLTIFTVDQAGGSGGMTPGEVADVLLSDYGVYNAINLDGGGSTTLAMADPATGIGSILNISADNPLGRAVGSNLAIFAAPTPEPATLALLAAGGVLVLLRRRPAARVGLAALTAMALSGPLAAPTQAATIPYTQDFEGPLSGFATASTGAGTYQFSVQDQGGNHVYRHFENRTGGGSTWLMSSTQLTGLGPTDWFSVSSLVTPVQTITGVNCTAGVRFLAANDTNNDNSYLADINATTGRIRFVEWTGTTALVLPTTDTTAQPSIPGFALGKTYELTVVGSYAGPTLNLTVTATERGVPANSVSFNVSDASPRSGNYFGYRGGLGGGTTGTFIMDFDDLRVVPEPAAVTLLGLGSLALLRRRRVV